MGNYKANISFGDSVKFDHVLYYGIEGILRTWSKLKQSKVNKGNMM